MNRRRFIARVSLGAAALGDLPRLAVAADALPSSGGVIDHVKQRTEAGEPGRIARALGAANAFKEGDALVGLAAADEAQRADARRWLAATRLAEIDANPPFEDALLRAIRSGVDAQRQASIEDWTFGELKDFLLARDEPSIRAVMPGLSSDVIGCVVKLMADDELVSVSAKIFNPLPGSHIGAKGYLGARVQPNSPTDDPEDIRWQVFDGWSYAVGDVLLGTNPVSSEPAQVLAVERVLGDLVATFGLEDVLPHCVLAHIDVQAEVERRWPGSTALWFQSIAGSDAANATFDLTLEKMLRHADARTGRFAFYLETGQGADFTNGHAQGMDMVLHESRKYGLARLLSQRVAVARGERAWLHLNDVAGFIGPEVFRTREQLVRCCLEDLVMGKLHGLCIGLDVCSTLHMDVSLDDLDHCLDAVAPAQPAYLMALPTKLDPMLGYMTTAFQDHVRLREKSGFRVDDRMWAFFQRLGVVDAQGRPTAHFGDPLWVHLQYRRQKGDRRSDAAIRAEGVRKMAAVRARGVFLAEGQGASPGELAPSLAAGVRRIYEDAKRSIRAEFDRGFLDAIPRAVVLHTRSRDRDDYILHPATGESLDDAGLAAVLSMRGYDAGAHDVQIVISDGLNALSILDRSQLDPFLARLRKGLARSGRRVSPQTVLVVNGRVRVGYRIGEILFGGLPGRRAVLHVIGERPGTGHRTFSVYMTDASGATWGTPGRADHDITRVVAGIANTALAPARAADAAIRILASGRGAPS